MSETPLTISVPEAGRRYFGLCRNSSYLAAARGELPTVRIGRLLRVPSEPWSACSMRSVSPVMRLEAHDEAC
jgi:hypothetical protein